MKIIKRRHVICHAGITEKVISEVVWCGLIQLVPKMQPIEGWGMYTMGVYNLAASMSYVQTCFRILFISLLMINYFIDP